MDTMEKRFEMVVPLASQMKTETLWLRESSTLLTSLETMSQIDLRENQAEEVLQRCSTDREVSAELILRLGPQSVKMN